MEATAAKPIEPENTNREIDPEDIILMLQGRYGEDCSC